MVKNNYFILTGAMGAGKSTVLNQLKNSFKCIDEPARIILKEERERGGDGVPEKNPERFNELMLMRMLVEYDENLASEEIIIFDRGVPDIIAYSELLNTNSYPSVTSAKKYRYNKFVFMFNGWEKIYTNDDERKIDFNTASHFGEIIKRNYSGFGYKMIDVPFMTVEERVSFILDKINKIKNEKET